MNGLFREILMVEWFKNLSEGWQTAIFGAGVAIALAAIGLLKWLFSKKEGVGSKAIMIDGGKNIIAGGDVSTGIDSGAALRILVDTSSKLGRSQEESEQRRQKIMELEQELAKHSLETNIALEKSTPVPSVEAKELAKLITEDDGLYAQALKAIAEGDNEKADCFLDETQEFLDSVQQKKDEAQAKIYMARMQNASYAGRGQEALQYCRKLQGLVGNNPVVLNDMAVVYHENAKYDEAEPMYRRVVKILENPGGEPLPNYAGALNNLAALLEATNRLDEAEPLMRRALAIAEGSFGPGHPNVATALNNLAGLLADTNRLDEAKPMYRRALAIDERSFGAGHPNVARDLNNLALLLADTNRLDEAEPMYWRVVKILENPGGEPLPNYAGALNNLAQLLADTNRLDEAEPLMRRALVIVLEFTRQTGHRHPHLEAAIKSYGGLLTEMGYSEDEVMERLKRLGV